MRFPPIRPKSPQLMNRNTIDVEFGSPSPQAQKNCCLQKTLEGLCLSPGWSAIPNAAFRHGGEILQNQLPFTGTQSWIKRRRTRISIYAVYFCQLKRFFPPVPSSSQTALAAKCVDNEAVAGWLAASIKPVTAHSTLELQSGSVPCRQLIHNIRRRGRC